MRRSHRVLYLSGLVFVTTCFGAAAGPAGDGGSTQDPLHCLLPYHPKISSAWIVTGPELVERVLKHSMVFSPDQAPKVLPELLKVLTKRRGWSHYVSTPGAYVDFDHGLTTVSYMSAHVYKHLIWPDGAKLLGVQPGGCVVEYFRVHKPKEGWMNYSKGFVVARRLPLP